MAKRKEKGFERVYMADLETTVYDGQTFTEAWASALIDMDAPTEPEYVMIHKSLDETLYYLGERHLPSQQ